jgi:hypothetical protein
MLSKILGFHGGDYEERRLLGRNTVLPPYRLRQQGGKSELARNVSGN